MKKFLFILALIPTFFLSSNEVNAYTEFKGYYQCYRGGTLLSTTNFDIEDGGDIYVRCNSSGWTNVNFFFAEYYDGVKLAVQGATTTFTWVPSNPLGFTYGRNLYDENNNCLISSSQAICQATYGDSQGYSFVLWADGSTNWKVLQHFTIASSEQTSILSSYQANSQINDDILNNQNQNAQNIINNQNYQANSIISNQDQNAYTINKNIENMNSDINAGMNGMQDKQDETNQHLGELNDTLTPARDCHTSPNLFDFSQVKSNYGIEVSISDEKIILNGTPTKNYAALLYLDSFQDILEDGQTYTLSSTETSSRFYAQVNVKDLQTGVNQYLYTGKGPQTFTVDKGKYSYILSVQSGTLEASGTFNNFEIGFQLEKGSSASPWEATGEHCTEPTFGDWFSPMEHQQQQTNEQLGELNDNITNSDVDVDSSFFSEFESDDHGLTAIITAPLNLIKSITSSKCSPLGIPIPFVNQMAYLPCMSEIYAKYFGNFLTIYQMLTFGLVSYWVCVRLLFMVKGFKDPNSDKIEVMDL